MHRMTVQTGTRLKTFGGTGFAPCESDLAFAHPNVSLAISFAPARLQFGGKRMMVLRKHSSVTTPLISAHHLHVQFAPDTIGREAAVLKLLFYLGLLAGAAVAR